MRDESFSTIFTSKVISLELSYVSPFTISIGYHSPVSILHFIVSASNFLIWFECDLERISGENMFLIPYGFEANCRQFLQLVLLNVTQYILRCKISMMDFVYPRT
jgi:hypothetical protein